MRVELTSENLSKIPGIIHGFGTKENPVPTALKNHWAMKPNWKQVHGRSFAWVTEANQECGEVDALITDLKGVPIAAVSADCVPILFAHRAGTRVASLHAGWRGTVARLPEALALELRSKGEDLKEWTAVIGPAIRACCYEVSPELADQFRAEFGVHATPDPARPRMLELQAVNEKELERLGFGTIEVLKFCTKCSTDPVLNSYRRDGAGVRQFSVIERSENRMTPKGLT